MAIYLLSARALMSSVSYDSVFELEDILVQSCDAQLLVPTVRGVFRWSQQQPSPVAQLSDRLLHRTIGFYRQAAIELPAEPNTLLIVALNGRDLGMLSSIPRWRQRFDRVIAYIFDAWLLESYPPYSRQLDRVFVPMPEIVDPLAAFLDVPVSLLPFGADVWVHGCGGRDRPIDLISYGRIPEPFQKAFAYHFNQPTSERLYYRSTPRSIERLPQQDYADRRDVTDRMQLYHLLRRSKLAVAFDTLYPGMRRFPHSFVTIRWFQCGGAGCGIVGKRPTTPLADQLLNWEDAAIELPDDPQASIELIEQVLSNPSRLHALHQRNYLQNLAQHDWRHRIAQLLEAVSMATPDRLAAELRQIASQSQTIARETEQAIGAAVAARMNA